MAGVEAAVRMKKARSWERAFDVDGGGWRYFAGEG